MSHTARRIGALSVLFASTALTPAFAQNAPLDEVIVTAQKREQSLQDVALSLDVIQDAELTAIRGAAEDILALSARVPSVYAEGSFGRTFPRFYIRGLGNTDFDLNANGPVSFVYDDVVLENPILRGFPIFDTDRVEVLRGPQGTLFGRNTPAGVIKFESVKPDVEDGFNGYGKASYGRFDTGTLEAAVGGALSDTVSARVSGLYQTRSPYVENTIPDQPEDDFEGFDELAGRAQLRFEPANSDLDVLVNVHGRQLRGGSRTFQANAIAPGGGIVDGFDRFSATNDAVQLLDVSNVGASLKAEWGLGNGTVTSVSAIESVRIEARGDVDGGFGAAFLGNSQPGFIPFPAESQDNINDHSQLTQELRYNFDASDAVNVTIGAFIFLEDLEIESLSFDTITPPIPVNGQAIQNQDTESYSLFTSVVWDATEQLTATLGLRATAESKDFTARRLIGPFGSGTLGPVLADLSDEVLSGDFTLDYEINDDVSVYGRYARGFRTPNVQGRIVFGDVVTVADTETIDSFEVGAKTSFADGRAVVNASAYLYNTNDQQVTAVGGAGNFNQLFNADSVKGRGFEIDAYYNPTDALQFTAGMSINDTEIDDPNLEVAPCSAACTVLDPINPVTGNAQIDGNPLPQAPKFIANATARYGFDVGSGELFVFGDIAHRSSVNFFLYESEEFQSEPLTEIGLRAGYVHAGGDWEVAGYVRNLTGEVALEGGVDFNNLTGFFNEPSIYGAEITKRF